jgi:hypothetical protein
MQKKTNKLALLFFLFFLPFLFSCSSTKTPKINTRFVERSDDTYLNVYASSSGVQVAPIGELKESGNYSDTGYNPTLSYPLIIPAVLNNTNIKENTFVIKIYPVKDTQYISKFYPDSPYKYIEKIERVRFFYRYNTDNSSNGNPVFVEIPTGEHVAYELYNEVENANKIKLMFKFSGDHYDYGVHPDGCNCSLDDCYSDKCMPSCPYYNNGGCLKQIIATCLYIQIDSKLKGITGVTTATSGLLPIILKNETPMDQTIMNVLFICGAVVAVLIIV